MLHCGTSSDRRQSRRAERGPQSLRSAMTTWGRPGAAGHWSSSAVREALADDRGPHRSGYANNYANSHRHRQPLRHSQGLLTRRALATSWG